MRRRLLFTVFLACSGLQAMPLGLRTAMWGVARAKDPVLSGDDDPIPALAADASPDAVVAAISGSLDGALVGNINDSAQYSAYYNWACSITNTTTASAWTIKRSPHAWLSFALGADALIGRAPTSDDVKIESFMPSTDGKFYFTVSVRDVNIGGGVVAVETLKANLRRVLELEGSATLAPELFTANNIEILFDIPIDGKVRFSASPPPDADGTFFMRVRLK